MGLGLTISDRLRAQAPVFEIEPCELLGPKIVSKESKN